MHYHAHVYFELEQLAQATQLHSELSRLPVRVGRIHTQAIGPHPKPMFQVLFSDSNYEEMRSWLDLHRDGLDVLVHKETGDALEDHTNHVEWLGNAHVLRLDQL